MNPNRVDFVVDLAYGLLIFIAVVLFAVVGNQVGIAFGLGVLVSYVIHVSWKMARFDPDWMTREVTENVEETLKTEVDGVIDRLEAVNERVDRRPRAEEVEKTVDQSVDRVSEDVEETVEAKVGAVTKDVEETVETVSEDVEETVEEAVEETVEDAVEETVEDAVEETVEETVEEAVGETVEKRLNEVVDDEAHTSDDEMDTPDDDGDRSRRDS